MGKFDQKRWKHKIRNLPKAKRIVDYCAEAFPILGSRTAAKKAIDQKKLLLNGKPARFSDILKKGDFLELQGSNIKKAKSFDFDLEIIFEDEFLVVVNKPGGIAVNGNRNKTVENALANLNQKNTQPDALPRPVAVHRIDVPTCGIVLLAKTKKALIDLSKAFQKNQVKKEYLAVVHGQPAPNGTINTPIQNKPSETKFEMVRTVRSRVFQQLSMVRLFPITGRTHQLRIHLKEKGHLIVGDKMYAENVKTILGKGLLLCAAKIGFRHPKSGEWMNFEIKPPAKFEKVLEREGRRNDL